MATNADNEKLNRQSGVQSRVQKYEHSKKVQKKKPNPIRKFFKTPKGTLLLLLILLTAVSFLVMKNTTGWIILVESIGTALLLDLMIAILLKRKKKFSDGGLLTGFIIGLVLSPTAHWYVAVAAVLIAILSKHLLKVKKKPILNPAGAGLLAVIYLFSAPESWWGGLSLIPVWFIPIVIVAGLYLSKKINKLPLVFAFLGSYFLIFLLLTEYFHFSGMSGIFRVPYINSVLFLAFFMLTDPPTSAVRNGEQVGFGILAAGVCAASYIYLGGLSYLLIGLLMANLWKTATAAITK